jgi:hypothetical protein
VYARLAAAGVEFGAAFRGLVEGWSAPRTALARLADPPAAPYVLHPALLDAALQSVALPGDAPADRAFVPAAVRGLRFTGLRSRPAWAACRLLSLSEDAAVLSVHLFDEQERLVLTVDGFELTALSAVSQSVFEVEWQPVPVPAAGVPAAGGTWLILADDSGVGDELGRRLGAIPHVLVRTGTEFTPRDDGSFTLDPRDPTHLARLFDQAFAEAPPERVVHLLALDAEPVGSAAAAASSAELCCVSVLHLVRALSERTRSRVPRLFLVTRCSQSAGGSAEVRNPQQALAWGFGAAVAQEHPEMRPTMIDLPAAGGGGCTVDAAGARGRRTHGRAA